ncbi:unnamed protein product [marine sediment metagenome]|uniref:Uncharacterized protein n=1 Tax=marine sediment metagenome TaxID=412755 RepID=X1AET0_9ZZZZ
MSEADTTVVNFNLLDALLTSSKIISAHELCEFDPEDLKDFTKRALTFDLAHAILEQHAPVEIERPAIFDHPGLEIRLTVAVLKPDRYKDLLKTEQELKRMKMLEKAEL